MGYGVEEFSDDLKAFLQANLNTKLAAIDADKNDGITMGTIDTNAYFFQTLSGEIGNYPQFVIFGVESFIDGNNHPAQVDISFNAKVIIVTGEMVNDPNEIRRLFRYQRALLELFKENFDQVSSLGTIKVSGLAPDFVDFVGRHGLDRFIGVNLEVHLPL